MSVESTGAVAVPVVEFTNNSPAVEAPVAAPLQAEVAAPIQPETSAMDTRLGAKFAALSRKEKETKAYEAKLKQERDAFMKERSEWETQRTSSTDSLKSLKEKMQQSPLQALQEEFGLTYEQLSEMVLNDGNPTAEMKMKRMQEELDRKFSSKLEEMERLQAEKEKSEVEKQTQAVRAQFMNQINAEISAKSDEYETIVAYEKQHEVFDLMELVYENEGRVMDINEAAQLVEAELLEEVRKEEARILQLKKLKRAQTPAPEPLNTQTAPTLSNDLASQSPQAGERKLSIEESKAKAASLLQWRE